MALSVFPYVLLAAAQLKSGRYLGYLAVDGSDKKFAAVFDTYVVQPHDQREFPRQSAILKVTLGGLGGHEYETQVYDNVRYDFDQGVMSLESTEEDVVVTARVGDTGNGGTNIDGQIFVRSAGAGGTLHVEYQTDEPGVSSNQPAPDEYVPALHGQYRGACGPAQYPALLQVESARALDFPGLGERHGLFDYAIRGRLGTRDDVVCGSGQWCAMRVYIAGAYDFFARRLTLTTESGTDECEVSATGLRCAIHMTGDTVDQCLLTRDPSVERSVSFGTRTYFLRTTPAQRARLPEPNPPENTALVEALRGNYTGNVFHEATGLYQPLRLNVMASTSTDNPHNENLVYITATSMLHFGRGDQPSRDFWSQPFEPRSFYLTPGFTLDSSGSDAFLQINDWRAGYLRGVWFSQQFGRVGTFELVKSPDLQTPPADTQWVAAIPGEYSGAPWWFRLLMPVQQPRAEVSTAHFVGETQSSDGVVPRLAIVSGSYDFYHGSLAWIMADGRLVAGRVADSHSMSLYWPAAPVWSALMDDSHSTQVFSK